MSDLAKSSSIQFPYKYNISCGNASPELWNKGNTVYSTNNNVVNKTIYDPCISYFEMPRSACSTGFTSTGGSSTDVNTSRTFNRGWYIYTLGWKIGSVIFIPALGTRDTNSNLMAEPTIYWNSGIWSGGAYGAYDTAIFSTYIWPTHYAENTYAGPIIPVIDN